MQIHLIDMQLSFCAFSGAPVRTSGFLIRVAPWGSGFLIAELSVKADKQLPFDGAPAPALKYSGF